MNNLHEGKFLSLLNRLNSDGYAEPYSKSGELRPQ